VPNSTLLEIIKSLFENKKEYTSTELHDGIKMELGRLLDFHNVSRERANIWKAYMIKQGIVVAAGTLGTRSVRYSLKISNASS